MELQTLGRGGVQLSLEVLSLLFDLGQLFFEARDDLLEVVSLFQQRVLHFEAVVQLEAFLLQVRKQTFRALHFSELGLVHAFQVLHFLLGDALRFGDESQLFVHECALAERLGAGLFSGRELFPLRRHQQEQRLLFSLRGCEPPLQVLDLGLQAALERLGLAGRGAAERLQVALVLGPDFLDQLLELRGHILQALSGLLSFGRELPLVRVDQAASRDFCVEELFLEQLQLDAVLLDFAGQRRFSFRVPSRGARLVEELVSLLGQQADFLQEQLVLGLQVVDLELMPLAGLVDRLYQQLQLADPGGLLLGLQVALLQLLLELRGLRCVEGQQALRGVLPRLPQDFE